MDIRYALIPLCCLVIQNTALADDPAARIHTCDEHPTYSPVDPQAVREYAHNMGASCATLPMALLDHLVALDADFAAAVFAADLDGDDDVDIVAGSGFDDTVAWYENLGAVPNGPPSFAPHVISETADFVRGVFVADVNGDQRMDVLTASGFDDTIAWYENDGATPPTFTFHAISTNADFARSVYAADLDGDNDIDVLSASNVDDKVAWYENNGADPPSFSERVITTSADGARSVFAADVNGDSRVDVLSASGQDNSIRWYRNNGATPPAFVPVLITNAATGAEAVFAANLDGDADIDVLVASGLNNTVAWYENSGGLNPTFTQRVITSNAAFASAVFAVDFDNDTDVDVITAAGNDNAFTWWANNGASPPLFTAVASAEAQGAAAVYAADVNDDAVPDVVAAASVADRVLLYELIEPPLGTCCKADGSCVETICESDCGVLEHGWAWSAQPSCANLTCPGGQAPARFLTDALNFDNFKQTIADLAAYQTRHWSQPENILAVNSLAQRLESFGYDNVTLDPYMFSGQLRHNVYATKMGSVEPTKMYILGAHMDSININGDQTNAPGADDDASGCASVLEMARLFARVQTDVSIRFIFWNNEETGLDGAEAYVANHRDLQGTLEEPTWLGMIQQDMILYDHGPGPVPDADVEYQTTATDGGAAVILAEFVSGAMQRYGDGGFPSDVGNNMNFTDSVPFQAETAAISVRENQRVAEIGAGSNPHWHQPTDLYETYTEDDFLLGFNICRMICGAVGELVNAQSFADGDADADGDVDLLDYEQFLSCRTGPDGTMSPDCISFDFDLDIDVDLADLGAFQLVRAR